MSKQESNRSAVVVKVCAGASAKEIVRLVNVSGRTIYYINKAWESDKLSYTPTRKKYKRRSNTDEWSRAKKVEKMVEKNPARSMRSMAREIGYSDYSLRRVMAKNIGYKSYALRAEVNL